MSVSVPINNNIKCVAYCLLFNICVVLQTDMVGKVFPGMNKTGQSVDSIVSYPSCSDASRSSLDLKNRMLHGAFRWDVNMYRSHGKKYGF